MAFNAQMLDETGKAIVAALKAMNGESSEDASEGGSTYRPLITDATGREILDELKKITPGGGGGDIVVAKMMLDDDTGNITCSMTSNEIAQAVEAQKDVFITFDNGLATYFATSYGYSGADVEVDVANGTYLIHADGTVTTDDIS